MNKYYLTTDTHFNHAKVVEYCDRPTNHEELIFGGLKAIPEGNILIHLGDICIGQDEAVHAKYIQPLKLTKILVRGNHDKKSVGWYLDHGWNFVCDSFCLKQFGKKIKFTHMPAMDDGSFNVNCHGHLHNNQHRTGDFAITPKHKLLALELTSYKPVLLDTFILK